MNRSPGTRTGSLCFGSYKKLSVSGTWDEGEGVTSTGWKAKWGQAREGLVDQVRCLNLILRGCGDEEP